MLGHPATETCLLSDCGEVCVAFLWQTLSIVSTAAPAYHLQRLSRFSLACSGEVQYAGCDIEGSQAAATQCKTSEEKLRNLVEIHNPVHAIRGPTLQS